MHIYSILWVKWVQRVQLFCGLTRTAFVYHQSVVKCMHVWYNVRIFPNKCLFIDETVCLCPGICVHPRRWLRSHPSVGQRRPRTRMKVSLGFLFTLLHCCCTLVLRWAAGEKVWREVSILALVAPETFPLLMLLFSAFLLGLCNVSIFQHDRRLFLCTSR